MDDFELQIAETFLPSWWQGSDFYIYSSILYTMVCLELHHSFAHTDQKFIDDLIKIPTFLSKTYRGYALP